VILRGDAPYVRVGVPPPSDLVRFATPLLRAATDLWAALAVGGLFAA